MFKKILSCVLILLMLSSFFVTAFADNTSVNPSEWAAVDGLGRTLSGNEETGDKKQDKFVGMFYWIWHYPWVEENEAITTGSVLDKYPEAVNDFYHEAWNNTYDGRPYFWDEPVYGFYSNLDEYVLRKHAELLADADIDVIIFDTTNDILTFEDAYETLFRVWTEAKNEGVDVPQVAFLLNFAGDKNTRTQLTQLYNDVYSKGRYSELWFLWEGKPLVMADSSSLNLLCKTDREIFNFFTFRDNESTYFADDTSFFRDTWGWCSDYEQTKFGVRADGSVEQMCVSVAQNANENGLSAMNNPEGTVQGRAFSDGEYSYSYEYAGEEIVVSSDMENACFYGVNFQQQWDYAIEQDPDFIFVTGFNEWIAGRFEEWNGTANAFPDQFSPEYSRDIEPSEGVLKDYYYYQLVENVRRFKGTDAHAETNAQATIDIYADASQWDNITPVYNHYEGSTKNRDCNGWLGLHYTNNTMRNDIVKSRVAYDENNIYFYVETKAALTLSTDDAWMRLFLDTDTTGVSANWEGFEYIINRENYDGKVSVERLTEGFNTEKVGEGELCVKDNILQISVSRDLLGMTQDDVKFNFKWSDNMQENDIMDFYKNGDVAPGGRFTFVFDSTSEGSQPQPQPENEDAFSAIRLYFEDIADKFNEYYIMLRKIFNYLF